MNRSMKVAWGTLGVSLVVVSLKFAAWWVTGSVALYSDALECIINVVAACTALIALNISRKPADDDHPYGHQKAEYFSAVVEGVMILGTAVAILHEVYNVWSNPHTLEAPLQGIALNGLATLMNAGWGWFMVRVGRRWKSPALLAGGKHVLTDVWTSGGVLTGFIMVHVTGILRLDPMIACLVALNIVWTGYTMLRDSVGALMDQAADPEVLGRMRGAISANATGAIEAHDLRTRQAGDVTFVEFHLVVPARMAVEDAHVICDRIEAGLRQEVGEAVIHIHVEPEGKAKHHGVVVLS
jgi:cation diffusion facilitator family transporter